MYLLPNHTMSLLFAVALVAILPAPTLQQLNPTPFFIAFHCGITNYTIGSPYQNNLNTLFSALESNSSSSSFYQTTIAEGSVDTVYGRYYCRHDLSLPVCSDCVHAATKHAASDCPNVRGAIIYSEQCTLIYLNSTARLDIIDLASPWGVSYSPTNVSNPNEFYPVLKATTDILINETAYGSGPEGFATEEARVSSFQTLYSLAQCAPDRLGNLCERCLRKALLQIDSCCSDKAERFALFYPHCQIWYSVQGPFYDVPYSPPGTPPPPMLASPPPPVTLTPGNWATATLSNNVLNLGIILALSTIILGN